MFATNSVLLFDDPDPAGNPRRFFRAREQSNNLFQYRFVISGLPMRAFGNNQGAVSEPGEPALTTSGSSLFAAGSPLWWSWTAPVSGEVGIISSRENGFPTLLGVFTGSDLSNLVAVQNSAPNIPGEFDFNAVAGATYQIVVDSAYDSVSGFSQAPHGNITLEIAGPPPNDNFANRILLTGAVPTTNGWNILATIEPNEPAFPSQSVWYSWVAPASGTATFFAKGIVQPLVNIYTGTSLSRLAPVGVLSDIQNYFEAVGGVAYQLQVDSSPPCLFALTMNLYPNQDPLLLSLPAKGGSVSVSPPPNTNGMYAAGTVVALTANPATGFVFGGWNNAPSITNASLSVVMTNEQTIGPLFHPVNDNFANRIALSGANTAIYGFTAGATTEPNEPFFGTGETVWYSWTAPAFGTVSISEESAGAPQINAYTGDLLANLVPVVPNSSSTTSKTSRFFSSETSTITFDVNSGTTYQLQAEGNGDDFLLKLNLAPPRPPVITNQPQSESVTAGGSATFSVAAAGFGALNYQWLFNGTNIPGATNASLSLKNITTNQAGAYTVVVGGNYGGTTSAAAFLTVQPAWTLTVLHAFTGSGDGANPQAGLVEANDGNFYGTIEAGSTNLVGGIYLITSNGTFTTLHAFTGGADGAGSLAGLIQGRDGKLYGTSIRGGNANSGTAFAITTKGVFTTLHSFSGGIDGGYPFAGLAQGMDGALYGATSVGGGSSGAGTIFRLTTNGALATLHYFAGGSDGGNAEASLTLASDGSFYGTTFTGGAAGGGTVFRVTTNGALATLHSFAAASDGANCRAALVFGIDGNLYGTASTGGVLGGGTVFRITTDGVLTVIYSFSEGNDGDAPFAGLIQSADGTLYGTTSAGGVAGHGTVFRIATNGTFTVLHSFTGGNDGQTPVGGVVADGAGNLYGTASTGGMAGNGVIFVLSPPP